MFGGDMVIWDDRGSVVWDEALCLHFLVPGLSRWWGCHFLLTGALRGMGTLPTAPHWEAGGWGSSLASPEALHLTSNLSPGALLDCLIFTLPVSSKRKKWINPVMSTVPAAPSRTRQPHVSLLKLLLISACILFDDTVFAHLFYSSNTKRLLANSAWLFSDCTLFISYENNLFTFSLVLSIMLILPRRWCFCRNRQNHGHWYGSICSQRL